MSVINVNSTISMDFYFIDGGGSLVDPNTVSGEIFLDDTSQGSFFPTKESPGIYSFLWTPATAGSYKLQVTGSFTSIEDIVIDRYFLIGGISPVKTLTEAYAITLLGELDPLFLDPEYVLNYYPDGDLVEITELIYRYSSEVLFLLNTNNTEITPLIQDYILASVLCDLSKIYIFNGGLGGFTSSDSITLGDLAVKSSAGSGSSSKGTGRGGASTWCEMASILRGELTSSKAGMKAIVRGSNFENPIPQRRLKRIG